jgi:AcrR family transcriptional regulator
VADIVKRGGLSNQAFYRHFESEDELVVSLRRGGNMYWSSALLPCVGRARREQLVAGGW